MPLVLSSKGILKGIGMRALYPRSIVRHACVPVTAAMCLFGAVHADAVTTIEFWHSMNGSLNDKVNQIAADFNKSQSEYQVKPVYRGEYSESMTSAIAAFRAHKAPTIVQIFEVGTASMMAAKGAIEPVYELMEKSSEPFDPNAFLPAVTGYYSTPDNKMLSLPFNSSTPVLYINRSAFEKAGIKQVPATWEEMDDALQKVVSSNAASCGMTSTWPSWIMIENFTARHNLPFASNANGFKGTDTQLELNEPEVVNQVQRLADWSKDNRFRYGGRADKAMSLFYSGQCAVVAASSASLANVRDNAKNFDYEVAQLPYSSTVLKDKHMDKPLNSIIGGASLWVMSGQSEEKQKAAAAFFHYLSSPKVQADWHQFSGYLPITTAAYTQTRESGFYDKNPGTDVAIKQLTSGTPTDNSRGLRLGNMAQIRDVIEEELEKVFNGQETPKQGLDNAVTRGNQLLKRFQTATRS